MRLLTDNDLMPFGIYKDIKMANVPSEYLAWLYENDKSNPEVDAYIEYNLDVISKDIGYQLKK